VIFTRKLPGDFARKLTQENAWIKSQAEAA
jgi:hypothetical protein